MTAASKPWPVTTACCQRKTKKEKDGIAVLFLLLCFLFIICQYFWEMFHHKPLGGRMVENHRMGARHTGTQEQFQTNFTSRLGGHPFGFARLFLSLF